jgi:predicted Zn-dependent peptidase
LPRACTWIPWIQALTILLLVACGASPEPDLGRGSAVNPGASRVMRFLPSPESRTQDNGLRVQVIGDPQSRLVHLVFAVRAGTTYEPEGKWGIAELTARVLLHGGSSSLPADAMSERLRGLGVEVELSVEAELVVMRAACKPAAASEVLGLLSSLWLAPLRGERTFTQQREKMLAERLAELSSADDDRQRRGAVLAQWLRA